MSTLYDYKPLTPQQVTREPHENVGSGVYEFGSYGELGDAKQGFKDGLDFEIWSAASGGVQLDENTDYTLENIDTFYSSEAGYDIYTGVQITNVTYQTGFVYVTRKVVLSYIEADTINDIVDQVSGLSKTPMRQTILDAKTTAGIGDFLTFSGAQASIDTDTGSSPMILSFANGFSSTWGSLDYLSEIDADTSPANWDFSAEADDTYYLYAENDGAGVLTYDKTTVAPEYGETLPAFGTAGLFFFVVPEMKWYSDSGAAWSEVNIVLLGFTVVASFLVSSVQPYAVQDRFVSGEFAITLGTAQYKTHYSAVTNPAYLEMSGYIRGSAGGDEFQYRALNNVSRGSDGTTAGERSGDVSWLEDGDKCGIYVNSQRINPSIAVGGRQPNNATSGFAMLTLKRGF